MPSSFFILGLQRGKFSNITFIYYGNNIIYFGYTCGYNASYGRDYVCELHDDKSPEEGH